MGAALDAIARGSTRTLEAGRVTYTDRSGRPATVFFLNIASFGISGLTTELVNRAPKSLGGRVSFLVGTLRGIVRYRAADHPVLLRLDGAVVHRGPVALGTAANGRYFGGGGADLGEDAHAAVPTSRIAAGRISNVAGSRPSGSPSISTQGGSAPSTGSASSRLPRSASTPATRTCLPP